jgi:hypothetical protein
LFKLSRAVAATLVPPNFNYVINQDGTVSVMEMSSSSSGS